MFVCGDREMVDGNGFLGKEGPLISCFAWLVGLEREGWMMSTNDEQEANGRKTKILRTFLLTGLGCYDRLARLLGL